jgi:uncharacterized metal-binding protein YceD (DUF177 family)
MITIPIQGLKDGSHTVEIQVQTNEVEDLVSEFSGEVVLSGVLTKLGKRMNLVGKATASALLQCDYSLEDYTEEVTAEIEMSFVLDTELFLIRRENPVDETYDVHIIREDEKVLDVTEEVAQELSVRLPLKRIAPQYRDKDIKDIIGDTYLDSGESINTDTTPSAFEALKNLRFDN